MNCSADPSADRAAAPPGVAGGAAREVNLERVAALVSSWLALSRFPHRLALDCLRHRRTLAPDPKLVNDRQAPGTPEERPCSARRRVASRNQSRTDRRKR